MCVHWISKVPCFFPFFLNVSGFLFFFHFKIPIFLKNYDVNPTYVQYLRHAFAHTSSTCVAFMRRKSHVYVYFSRLTWIKRVRLRFAHRHKIKSSGISTKIVEIPFLIQCGVITLLQNNNFIL